MNRRGEYGRGPRAGGKSGVRYVPVLDVAHGPDQAHRPVAHTTRVALWDPEAELVCGAGPSYYTESDGGWWYFNHPAGEMWLEGRRYRPWRPRIPTQVYEADPSLRVGSGFWGD